MTTAATTIICSRDICLPHTVAVQPQRPQLSRIDRMLLVAIVPAGLVCEMPWSVPGVCIGQAVSGRMVLSSCTALLPVPLSADAFLFRCSRIQEVENGCFKLLVCHFQHIQHVLLCL